MAQAPLTLRRWKRLEYDRLVDLGVFERDPVELIGGQLVVAEPHGSYHASAITATDYAVRASLPPGWIIRVQLSVALDDESEPEPDIVVVPGRRRRTADLPRQPDRRRRSAALTVSAAGTPAARWS
ncbi:MAG TPA: Uma2 family endonuclease [Candidatus Binatia bacterium]|nr:Uma2 family endonuclease [Candidatus Binatia bacterium]